MDNNEANKVISNYMGGPYIGDACQDDIYGVAQCTEKFICEACDPILEHYLSLDALVPVWEKAVLEIHNTNWHNQKEWHVVLFKRGHRFDWSRAKTIQEAAAHATAKAILELNEKEQND